MARKTEEVFELVQDVLSTKQEPYSEDITDEVCQAIERNLEWKQHYKNLCIGLTKDVINNHIGYYTRKITGKMRGKQVKAQKSKLIKSYSKLA